MIKPHAVETQFQYVERVCHQECSRDSILDRI